MADRFYLNLWFPSFTATEMMPRLLSVIRQFPSSATEPGVTYVAVHPVAWSEPTVLERRFRPGIAAEEAIAVLDEEIAKLQREPPADREVQRTINQIEASFYRQMERVGSYSGKADQLNAYFAAGGGPDYFAEDLARYTSLSPSDIQAAVLRWLPSDRRVELSVQPEGAK